MVERLVNTPEIRKQSQVLSPTCSKLNDHAVYVEDHSVEFIQVKVTRQSVPVYEQSEIGQELVFRNCAVLEDIEEPRAA